MLIDIRYSYCVCSQLPSFHFIIYFWNIKIVIKHFQNIKDFKIKKGNSKERIMAPFVDPAVSIYVYIGRNGYQLEQRCLTFAVRPTDREMLPSDDQSVSRVSVTSVTT